MDGSPLQNKFENYARFTRKPPAKQILKLCQVHQKESNPKEQGCKRHSEKSNRKIMINKKK